LLSGISATTFHHAYADFAARYPDIQLKRGGRFVEEGNLATSGGLSSGIDLAFRMVERYYGREAGERTAYGIEYQGRGWLNPDSNEIYANKVARPFFDQHPLCPVCSMYGDPAFSSVYKGKTYFLCEEQHKHMFDAAPAKFGNAA
jgi:YHS domain-containing protein